jgi:hypothetical protein
VVAGAQPGSSRRRRCSDILTRANGCVESFHHALPGGGACGWREARPAQVTFFPDGDLFLEEPEVSSDGKKLFYIRSRRIGDIWILGLGAGAVRSPS